MQSRRMQSPLAASLLCAALLLPGAAFAQACVYDFTPANVDFGAHFQVWSSMSRPKRVMNVTVTCPAPKKMQWFFENQFGGNLQRYRLDNAGHFTVRVSNATVDGVPAQVANMRHNHSVANWGESVQLSSDYDNGFMVGNPSSPEAHFRTMTARIAFDATIDGVPSASAGLKQTVGTFVHHSQSAATDVLLTTTIVPGSCALRLSDNGIIQLGNIPYETLNATTPTVFPDRVVSASLTCTNAIPVAMITHENRPGTAWLADATPETAQRSFGLSRTSQNAPIGAYQVLVEDPRSDGAPASVVVGNYVGGWTTRAPMYLQPAPVDQYWGIGNAGTGLVPITNATWNLRVKPVIAPRNTLLLRSATPVNGSITLTLVYP